MTQWFAFHRRATAHRFAREGKEVVILYEGQYLKMNQYLLEYRSSTSVLG